MYGMVRVKKEYLFGRLSQLRDTLTYKPRVFGDAEEVIIRNYRENLKFIWFPSSWFFKNVNLFEGINYKYNLCEGISIGYDLCVPDSNHPKVYDKEGQRNFMDDMLKSILSANRVIATAATGSGKTVCALYVASQLKLKTLIIVHLEQLVFQWRDQIHDVLGVDYDNIGILQGKKAQLDKDFVIAMMPTLATRSKNNKIKEYKDKFTEFGLVIYDEIHRAGAPMLSHNLGIMPAKYQLGLSATPKRGDGAHILYEQHLGFSSVQSESSYVPARMHSHPYYHKYKVYGTQVSGVMGSIAKVTERNLMLVKFIERFYKEDRHILVVSHVVKHLENLLKWCVNLGIPVEEMGVCVRKGSDGKVNKQDKITDLLKTKRIIFATYQLIETGVDLHPRFDCGIEATPSSKCTQIIGRIRRWSSGKRVCDWISPRDILLPNDPNGDMITRFYYSRKRSCKESKIEVLNHE